jgi:hypothetical protein
MTDTSQITPVRTGTLGGTITILLANIHSAELFKTAVLAAVGAIVSFGCSMLMKRLLGRRKKPS